MKLLTKIFGVSVVASATIIPLTQCSCSNANDSWGGYDDLIPGEQGENKICISSKNSIKFEKGKTYTAKFDFSSMPEFVKYQENKTEMTLLFENNPTWPPEESSEVYMVEEGKDVCSVTIGGQPVTVSFERSGSDPTMMTMEWKNDYATKTFSLAFTPINGFDTAYFVLTGGKK